MSDELRVKKEGGRGVSPLEDTMGSLLSRDAILGAVDLVHQDVDVPEWGGTVRVRMLTGTERDQFEASTMTRQGKKLNVNLVNIRARLVAMCVVDEKGNRMFADADVEALAKKSSMALHRVFEAARHLNGLTEEAAEDAKENFTAAPNGDSTFD